MCNTKQLRNLKRSCKHLSFLFILILVTSVLLLSVKSLSAEEKINPFRWEMHADKFDYSMDGTVTAYGNVSIKNAEKTLKADQITYVKKTGTAIAEGNIMLTSGKDILTGSRIEINLNTEEGTLYDGKIFLSENHFYISGKEIKKIGKNEYSAESARVTSCDGPSPDWVITGKKVNVKIEGYGTIKHAAFWAKKAPVLYSPYFVFPAKQKRQTGLLIPQVGASSKLGYQYNQPFFWAISENTDATFYYNFLSERGNKVGAEFRYVIKPESHGAIMVDYLDDKKDDDGSGDWGYVDLDEDIIRKNSERYWFRMKHATTFENGVMFNLDLDIVSDQDYLRDFRYGYSGYNDTETFFNDTLGRSLDPYDDNIRENSVTARKNWDKFNFIGKMLWFDDVVLKQSTNDDDLDTTLQALPSLEFNGVRQKIWSSPFYFDLDTEYRYYYRKDIDDMGAADMEESKLSGHRGDLYSRLYLPLPYKYIFNFEPSVGLRETMWYISDYDIDDDREQSFSRFIPDLKLDFSTDMHKIFNSNMGRIQKVKHSMIHNFVYDFIPENDQDDLPYFVSADRIEEKNEIAYYWTNSFISRFGSQANPDKNEYREFFWFKLKLGYDFNELRDDIIDPEPVTPLKFETRLTPFRYLSWTSDATWSFYNEKFESFNTGLRLSDKRGDSIFTEYRYLRDDVTYEADKETLYGRLNAVITKSLSAFAEFEYNIYNNTIYEDDFVKKAAGIFFKRQCWSVEFSAMEENDSTSTNNDIRFTFLIGLTGLGQYGQDFKYGY